MTAAITLAFMRNVRKPYHMTRMMTATMISCGPSLLMSFCRMSREKSMVASVTASHFAAVAMVLANCAEAVWYC